MLMVTILNLIGLESDVISTQKYLVEMCVKYIYIYIYIFGPVKPELEVIPSEQKSEHLMKGNWINRHENKIWN